MRKLRLAQSNELAKKTVPIMASAVEVTLAGASVVYVWAWADGKMTIFKKVKYNRYGYNSRFDKQSCRNFVSSRVGSNELILV